MDGRDENAYVAGLGGASTGLPRFRVDKLQESRPSTTTAKMAKKRNIYVILTGEESNPTTFDTISLATSV